MLPAIPGVAAGVVIAVVIVVVVKVVNDLSCHKWSSEPLKNTLDNGAKKQGNVWMCNCKKCVWNETHTSGFHVAWESARDHNTAIQLSATHNYWNFSENVWAVLGGTADLASGSAGGGGGAVRTSQLSELVEHHQP